MAKNSPFQQSNDANNREAAVKLIKERIKSLYGTEKPIADRDKSELVSRFWEQHKDDPNPQAAWQNFYSNLSDVDKQSLWNEYHSATAPQDHGAKAVLKKAVGVDAKPSQEPVSLTNDDAHAHNLDDKSGKRKEKLKKVAALKNVKDKESRKEAKEKLIENVKAVPKRKDKELNKKRSRHHWRPFFAMIAVMAFWLLAQYNPLLIALAKQYVSPGDTLRGPVIVDPNANIEIGDESRIIIPKINVDVPVVYDVRTRNEEAIQAALERGVVHYAGTSVPGEAGNNVIVGHSSNNFLNSGQYKFAFVLLDRLEIDDTFILHYQGTRYVYKVTNKQVIEPTDFSLTLPTSTPTTTLITCTPPGTSWRRLVVQAEQISPSLSAEQLDAQNIPEPSFEGEPEEIVPGNAPSFWQRILSWF